MELEHYQSITRKFPTKKGGFTKIIFIANRFNMFYFLNIKIPL